MARLAYICLDYPVSFYLGQDMPHTVEVIWRWLKERDFVSCTIFGIYCVLLLLLFFATKKYFSNGCWNILTGYYHLRGTGREQHLL